MLVPPTKREGDLRRIATQVRRCKKCPLGKSRTRAVPGDGPHNAKIFFVGEAPGREEDKKGRPFVGSAGKILDDALKKSGLRRDRVFITSILKCRPPKNRNPKAKEMTACRPYLETQIAAISPRAIVSLGGFGFKGLTGKSIRIAKTRTRKLEFEGTPLIATFHPAAILYNRKLLRKLVSDLKKAKALAERH